MLLADVRRTGSLIMAFAILAPLLDGCRSAGERESVVRRWECTDLRASTGEPESILGQWECTDLRAYEHISQFMKETLVFRPDGRAEFLLTDQEGVTVSPKPSPYRIRNGRISFDDAQDGWRYVIKGDELWMTFDESQNPEGAGVTLIYRRPSGTDQGDWSALVGTWECEDLRAWKTISQFAALTLVVEDGGRIEKHLRDRKGRSVLWDDGTMVVNS